MYIFECIIRHIKLIHEDLGLNIRFVFLYLLNVQFLLHASCQVNRSTTTEAFNTMTQSKYILDCLSFYTFFEIPS